jgi:small subunit ribosomal protein S20
MPIIKSAKKALRGSKRKRGFNLRRANALKDVTKETKKMITSGQVAEAQTNLSKAYQAIDKAAKRGIIKKNTAARKKSRLVKALNKAKSSK